MARRVAALHVPTPRFLAVATHGMVTRNSVMLDGDVEIRPKVASLLRRPRELIDSLVSSSFAAD